jgi:hypothetical protein
VEGGHEHGAARARTDGVDHPGRDGEADGQNGRAAGSKCIEECAGGYGQDFGLKESNSDLRRSGCRMFLRRRLSSVGIAVTLARTPAMTAGRSVPELLIKSNEDLLKAGGSGSPAQPISAFTDLGVAIASTRGSSPRHQEGRDDHHSNLRAVSAGSRYASVRMRGERFMAARLIVKEGCLDLGLVTHALYCTDGS